LIEWKHVRAELMRVIEAVQARTGMTQEQIAAAAGKSRQGYVSQIQNYDDASLGPHLMNFIKVLEGLEMKASDFFTAVEKRSAGLSPPLPPFLPSSPTEEDQRALEIGRLVLQALAVAGKGPGPSPRRRRKRH
jgi:hypothetical protein